MYPTVIRGHILGPPGLINPRGSWNGCSDFWGGDVMASYQRAGGIVS